MIIGRFTSGVTVIQIRYIQDTAHAQELKASVQRRVTVGLGGLGVMCSSRDPSFAGSNPAEVDGFFQDVKILSTSPPGGTLSFGFRV